MEPRNLQLSHEVAQEACHHNNLEPKWVQHVIVITSLVAVIAHILAAINALLLVVSVALSPGHIQFG